MAARVGLGSHRFDGHLLAQGADRPVADDAHCGHALAQDRGHLTVVEVVELVERDDDALIAWTLVPVLFLLCAAPFAKFVRWALFLEVPMRLGVAALLISQGASRRARVLAALTTLLLVVSQLLVFYRVFVVADVYDPTSVDLLVVLGFVPLAPLR